ncbi:MAG: response regulator transcription factor [Acidobacteria bacterium]|nr:response regulator transcription factor [Acidobacteriota bacterium]
MRALPAGHAYEVVESRGGDEALLRFRTELPDLVLIGQSTGGDGAYAICRALRSASDTPIIVVSSFDSAENVVAALDAGADDYVAQPFRTEELLARIRAVMRRKLAPADSLPPRLALDGVEIDFATRQITAKDRTAHLTPKEFELLKFLVSHAGRVVSHRTILQAIWGPDYDGQVDYLRVFINQLRKKIETDPSNPKFILTEPWVGYRFVLPDTFLNARAS